MPGRPLRLIYPHQLFDDHLNAPRGTRFLLVEDDLLLRQYAFHAHKLVLHRASAERFAGRLREAGFDVDVVESRAGEPTGPRVAAYVASARPDRVSVYDVVDDWLSRDLTTALLDGGYRLRGDDVLETPGFLTTRREFTDWFANHPARMQHFYAWQRNRLDILVDDGRPVGGRWSFDEENRKKLPKSHVPPPVDFPASRPPEVRAAIHWVAEEFPDAPGDPAAFAWPTDHVEARRHLDVFVRDRLAAFGPYEDAISVQHRYLYHGVLTPMLNTGLLTPREVIDAALAEGLGSSDAGGVPIASLEGFIRQVIGWREYMRATYQRYGRRMRSANRLGHARPLADGWWDASTGLAPDAGLGRAVLGLRARPPGGLRDKPSDASDAGDVGRVRERQARGTAGPRRAVAGLTCRCTPSNSSSHRETTPGFAKCGRPWRPPACHRRRVTPARRTRRT